jgi:hypothetical protein
VEIPGRRRRGSRPLGGHTEEANGPMHVQNTRVNQVRHGLNELRHDCLAWVDGYIGQRHVTLSTSPNVWICGHKKDAKNPNGSMHRDQVWVVFNLLESPNDIIVPNVKLRPRVSDP